MIKKLLFVSIITFCLGLNAQTSSADCDTSAGSQLTVGTLCNTIAWASTNNTDYWNNSAGCAQDLDDAWGWFVATSSSTTIEYFSNRDAILALFQSACSPTMVSVACADDFFGGNTETIVYNTTVGLTYRVRIQRFGENKSMNGSICVYNTPTLYDPCTTITNIADCGINTSSTFNAGIGAVDGACTFSANGQENVYTFTPTITGNYSIEQISSTNFVDYYYKAASAGCGSTGWTCTGAELDGAVTGGSFTLTAGTQYYIMADPEFTTGGSAVFNIACPPPPPANDDPCNAISLTVNSTCNFTTYTNEFATGTTGVPAPGCASYTGSDVWFTAIVPANGHLIVDMNSGVMTDSGMAFYSGTCSGLTLIECDDDGSTNPLMSSIDLTGLTPGQTIYIRVWEYGNNNNGTFDICATTVIPCITPTIDTTPNSCEMVIDEVGTDPFAITPYNPNPSFIIDCATTTVELATNAQMNETTSYNVIKIPYTYIGSFGATTNNSTISQDDRWADTPTNIGFPFCFYDDTKTDVLLGANSIITFEYDNNTSTFTPTPGEGSGFTIDTNLPSLGTGTDVFRNAIYEQAIYGVYHDIDPTGLPGTSITTRTQGIPGCRKFIAEWIDIPMFSDNSILYSGMIVLYESTNIVEVYIEEKRIDNNNVSPWNNGNAIVGMQGDYVGPVTNLANEYTVAPCRNGLDTNWEVTNEAWRFVPSGSSRLTGVEWYIGTDTSGVPDATTNTYTANAPGTYTAVSTYATCGGSAVTLTDQVVVSDGRKIWNGSVNTNWYEDANWTPSGEPTLNDCVVIPDSSTTPNNPIANQLIAPIPLPPTTPAMSRNLTLRPGAYLEIVTNTELMVREWVDVQNTGVFNIESSGSLIQIENSAINTGDIHMQRSPNFDESTVLDTEYIYWSSPVAGFQVTAISPASSQIYDWAPTSANSTAGSHGEWSSAFGAMTNGTGYIVRGLGDTPTTIPATAYAISNNTALFSGVPNNGIITKVISHGGYNGGAYAGVGNIAQNEDDNWNLLGNPYPSAISANAFTNLNTNINGTVYVWPHSSNYSAASLDPFYEDYVYNYDSNDYLEHNNTGSNPPGTNDLFIASGQAFFVLMNHTATSGTNVTFNNDMRYDNTINNLIFDYDNSNFYRMSAIESSEVNIERHRIWLDLLSPNDITNTLLVGYIHNATNNFDRLYDGYDFSSGDNSGFYSLLDDQTLSIQGRSLPFLQEDTVPLGIIANETGSHTIAINTLDGIFMTEDQYIYLEDTALNIIHDIRLSPYNFSIEEGVHNDRFILRYTNETLGINNLDNNDSISIIAPKSEYIKITSEIGIINSVAIYDIVGRVIFTTEGINHSEFILNQTKLSDGAYIVKVELNNGKRKIQKVVIRH
jgi:hypothetical protein